jgi:hypothetical protein
MKSYVYFLSLEDDPLYRIVVAALQSSPLAETKFTANPRIAAYAGIVSVVEESAPIFIDLHQIL